MFGMLRVRSASRCSDIANGPKAGTGQSFLHQGRKPNHLDQCIVREFRTGVDHAGRAALKG